MDLDFILLVVGGAVVVGLLSLGMAKLSNHLKKNTDIRVAKQILVGKRANSIKIDGETINITKHKWKDHDGKMQELEIKPIEQINTNKSKKGFLGLFKQRK